MRVLVHTADATLKELLEGELGASGHQRVDVPSDAHVCILDARSLGYERELRKRIADNSRLDALAIFTEETLSSIVEEVTDFVMWPLRAGEVVGRLVLMAGRQSPE